MITCADDGIVDPQNDVCGTTRRLEGKTVGTGKRCVSKNALFHVQLA
jgi:hypothetical protein